MRGPGQAPVGWVGGWAWVRLGWVGGWVDLPLGLLPLAEEEEWLPPPRQGPRAREEEGEEEEEEGRRRRPCLAWCGLLCAWVGWGGVGGWKTKGCASWGSWEFGRGLGDSRGAQ